MASPVIVNCPSDMWTKVATATSGIIDLKSGIAIPQMIYQTYRMTGETAPVNMVDAVLITESELAISATANIDVYIWPVGLSAIARVSL